MTKEKQLIAIAKLDGWKQKPTSVGYWGGSDNGMYPPDLHPMANLNTSFKFPDYLTSRDAIIPVILKSFNGKNFRKFDCAVMQIKRMPPEFGCDASPFLVLTLTAEQLAEALLRACGKWEE